MFISLPFTVLSVIRDKVLLQYMADLYFQLGLDRWPLSVYCLVMEMDDGDNWPKPWLDDRFIWWWMWEEEAGGRRSLISASSSSYHSVSSQHNILSGLKTREPVLSPQYLSLCPSTRGVTVSFHQVLVAATIRKKQNIKNRVSAPIVQETHCVDSRHFSCERLKSSGRNLQWDSERSRRIGLLWRQRGQQRSQMK